MMGLFGAQTALKIRKSHLQRTPSPPMSSIFISHSSKDKTLAYNLKEKLSAWGHDCFLDFQGIPGGAQWEQEVYDAMRRCAVVLVCATPRAIDDSRWVFAEIVMGRYSSRPVIPLIFQKCELPTNLGGTQYIDFTQNPQTAYQQLRDSLEKLDLTPAGPKWPKDKSPYSGLKALDEDYAAVFFGRQKELQAAITALRPGGQRQRFLTIVGPSGSGKSSLLRAGIIPALKNSAIDGSREWTYVPPFTPGQTPFRNLAEKLRGLDATLGSLRTIEAELRYDKGLFYKLLEARSGADGQVVVVIDQLEEIERRTPREEAEKFLAQVGSAISERGTPVIFLTTLRADFVSACLGFPELAEMLRHGTQLLGVMDRAALREVILGPARLAGVEFDEGLVEEILDDAGSGDALPLLAHVLDELWRKGKGGRDL